MEKLCPRIPTCADQLTCLISPNIANSNIYDCQFRKNIALQCSILMNSFTQCNVDYSTSVTCSLTLCHLTKSNLTQCTLTQCTLTQCTLTQCTLTRCTLTRCTLTRCTLTRCTLTQCTLSLYNTARCNATKSLIESMVLMNGPTYSNIHYKSSDKLCHKARDLYRVRFPWNDRRTARLDSRNETLNIKSNKILKLRTKKQYISQKCFGNSHREILKTMIYKQCILDKIHFSKLNSKQKIFLRIFKIYDRKCRYLKWYFNVDLVHLGNKTTILPSRGLISSIHSYGDRLSYLALHSPIVRDSLRYKYKKNDNSLLIPVTSLVNLMLKPFPSIRKRNTHNCSALKIHKMGNSDLRNIPELRLTAAANRENCNSQKSLNIHLNKRCQCCKMGIVSALKRQENDIRQAKCCRIVDTDAQNFQNMFQHDRITTFQWSWPYFLWLYTLVLAVIIVRFVTNA